jgi:hypothetical protein
MWLATCEFFFYIQGRCKRLTLRTMGAFKRPSAATVGTSRLRLPELGLADSGPGRLWRLWVRVRLKSAS